MRNPQSLNKYQYAFNNPLRYKDPDGHDPDPDPLDPQDPCKCLEPARGLIRDLEKLDRWIDKQLRPTKEIIGTATPDTIDPITITPTLPVPLPTTGTPPTSGRQPVPPPPITMGKGSTRDVRKINPGREAAGKKAVEDARAEVTRTKGVRNKTAADVEAYNAAKRALRHAVDKLKKSETDARKGRGNR